MQDSVPKSLIIQRGIKFGKIAIKHTKQVICRRLFEEIGGCVVVLSRAAALSGHVAKRKGRRLFPKVPDAIFSENRLSKNGRLWAFHGIYTPDKHQSGTGIKSTIFYS